MIKTVKEFVTALGGAKAVADLTGASLTSVYMAQERGIPGSWQLPIYLEAKRRKLQYDPKLLGMEKF